MHFRRRTLGLHTRHRRILTTGVTGTSAPNCRTHSVSFTDRLGGIVRHKQSTADIITLAVASARRVPTRTLAPPATRLRCHVPSRPSLSNGAISVSHRHARFTSGDLRCRVDLDTLDKRVGNVVGILRDKGWQVTLLGVFSVTKSTLATRSRHLGITTDGLTGTSDLANPSKRPCQTGRIMFRIGTTPNTTANNMGITSIVRDRTPSGLICRPNGPLTSTGNCMGVPGISIIKRVIGAVSTSHDCRTGIRILGAIGDVVLGALALNRWEEGLYPLQWPPPVQRVPTSMPPTMIHSQTTAPRVCGTIF